MKEQEPWPQICGALQQHTGNALTLLAVHPVSGGDINAAWQMDTSAGRFFVKVNGLQYPGLFRCELEGLQALAAANSIRIPAPVVNGVTPACQFLVTEWITGAAKKAGFWQQFGQSLARLHVQTAGTFGFPDNNYIGSLVQDNSQSDNWAEFYAGSRIQPLMRKAYDAGLCSKTDTGHADSLCNKLATLFPAEPPALLHGDLWGGNFMTGEEGEPVIYDPAVYYGHREMDIGMSLLFGGFAPAFYDHYQDLRPLAPGWASRVGLCQLYPLLVHLLLFGSSYYSRVRNILQQYG